MNILITGAAGFVGSHLAERFLADGHQVVGIDNLATGREENFPEPDDLPARSRLIVGDITDPHALQHAFTVGTPRVVYHCAASYRDPEDWRGDAITNVLGTISLLKAAQRFDVRRLVYFQTSLCYGLAPRSPVPVDAPLDPTSSYAISKTAAEQYIRLSGLDWVSLRLANIYGPRNLSGPVPAFYRRLSQGQPCTVVDTRRDFVFIDDLVDLAVQFAVEGSPGGVWHVGSGFDRPISDVFKAAATVMCGGTCLEVPRGEDDAETILLDASLTEQAFGWKASTPLADGIERAVDWYMAHGVEDTFTHLSLKG